MEWALCPLSLTISQFGHSVLPSQRLVNCVPYPLVLAMFLLKHGINPKIIWWLFVVQSYMNDDDTQGKFKIGSIANLLSPEVFEWDNLINFTHQSNACAEKIFSETATRQSRPIGSTIKLQTATVVGGLAMVDQVPRMRSDGKPQKLKTTEPFNSANWRRPLCRKQRKISESEPSEQRLKHQDKFMWLPSWSWY